MEFILALKIGLVVGVAIYAYSPAALATVVFVGTLCWLALFLWVRFTPPTRLPPSSARS